MLEGVTMELTRDPDTGEILLEELPSDTSTMIEVLDLAFPHKCIATHERPHEAHRYAGKRELIDLLLTLKQFEEEAQDEQEALAGEQSTSLPRVLGKHPHRKRLPT